MIYPNEYCNEYKLPLRLWLCKRLKSFEVRIENPREESEGLQILHIGAIKCGPMSAAVFIGYISD